MKFSHDLLLILIVLLANLQAQCTTIREIGRGVNRIKRQQCQDGFGVYEEGKCCNCPPGFHVETCQNGEPKCLSCEGESYLDHANLQPSCEPCTSCNPTANLETEEECTVKRNRVCRCKEGYYCDKPVREDCKVCHSCKKCEDGYAIEKECTPTNDTVCKKVEGGGPWWIIIIVLAIIGIGIGILYVIKKRKLICFAGEPNGNEVQDEERENNINERIPLKGIDLNPHLTYIVKELGPITTKELVRGDLTESDIQFIEEDARNDAHEKSYKMLNQWYEKQGHENAAPNLIKKLNDMDKKTTADKIMKTILADNQE